jgi:succinate dehydrogenase/fumarate reductase-like Fe-S protein
MKRKHPVKKLQLSSETLLQLNQVQLVQGGTLTFEGTCENSLCPACTALCTRAADARAQN